MATTATASTENGRNKEFSAKYREGLWKNVLSRREVQLKSLAKHELSKVCSESITSKETTHLFNAEHYRNHIKSVLENNFNRACDERLSATERQKNFSAFKAVFASIDRICADKKKSSNVISLENSSTSVTNDKNQSSASGDNNKNLKSSQAQSQESSTLPTTATRKESPPLTNKIPNGEDIITLSDSEDEATPQTSTYPNMLHNYSFLEKVMVGSDEHRNTSHSPYSSSMNKRPAVQLTLGNVHIRPEIGQPVIDRLTKWEPNYIIRENIVLLQTAPPLKVPLSCMQIKTALAFKFTIPQSYISHPDIKWKPAPSIKVSTTGKKLLLLRMIPKEVPKKYPDTHMWPKGTFLQLNSTPIVLNQRKQQSHDPNLWKSMCHSLDITSHIDPRASKQNTIEIVTYDENPFYLHLAIVEYISPEDLLSSVTNHVSSQTSLQQARYYVNRQTIKLDDDENTEQQSNSIPLTFSLTCPVSMVKISTPARGKHCAHIQCFDLLTFLSFNSFPSARRWRCAFCEKFTAVDELVICDLFTTLLKKFDGCIETGTKDKVELKDGSEEWSLVDQKLHKRGGVSEEQEDSIMNKRKKPIEEIILV